MLSIIVFLSVVTFQSNCLGSRVSSILKSNDFIEIRESPLFIDKTLLILKALSNDQSIIFTAPQGFGKSTNLDMIRVFLSNMIDHKVSQDLFSDTEVTKDGNFVKTNLGSHPVIYCSFEPNSPVSDYNSLLANFRTSLHKAFLQHEYLTNSKQLVKSDIEQFKKFIDSNSYTNLEPAELSSALKFLSKILKTHHDKQVVLLIDDYDTVIWDSLSTNILGIQEVLGFYDGVLSKVLTDKENIKKSILTGTSCILSKLLPSLGNTKCVGFLLDRDFETAFGLTGDEVDTLVDRSVYTKLRPNLTEWYDGYTSSDLSAHIYNTKSVLSFLLFSEGELKSYWRNLKVEKVLRILLEDSVRKTLLLDSPESLMFVVREIKVINKEAIEGVKNMITQEIWDADSSDLYFHLLMEQGYFTFDKPWERSGYNSSTTLRLANLDICGSLQKFINNYILEMKKLSSNLNIV